MYALNDVPSSPPWASLECPRLLREIGDCVDLVSAGSACRASLPRDSFTDFDSGELDTGFLTLEDGLKSFPAA